jgi:hypothetical protein
MALPTLLEMFRTCEILVSVRPSRQVGARMAPDRWSAYESGVMQANEGLNRAPLVLTLAWIRRFEVAAVAAKPGAE